MKCLRRVGVRILSVAAFVLMALCCAYGLEEEGCSDQNLKGAFGFTISGVSAKEGPFAIVGAFDADGSGKIAGAGTEAILGVIGPNQAFTGTYHVTADCKGTGVLTFTDSGLQSHLSFVLVDDGKEILIIVTDRGEVEFGSAKKQFSGPRHSE